MHEASLYKANCFITLTYDDQHLPADGNLHHEHFQAFMMRFRKSIYPKRVSYVMCGEYGEKRGRPHYHAIIFGHDFGEVIHRRYFSNQVPLGAIPNRSRIARSSQELSRLWTFGNNTVGSVTRESCSYVASYTLKKQTAYQLGEHINPDTGEIRTPEYARMSTRPAIGKAWFARHCGDVFAYDGVFVNGKRQPVPRYYDRLREELSPLELEKRKQERRLKAISHSVDNTPERLAVRSEVSKARTALKQRKL